MVKQDLDWTKYLNRRDKETPGLLDQIEERIRGIDRNIEKLESEKAALKMQKQNILQRKSEV